MTKRTIVVTPGNEQQIIDTANDLTRGGELTDFGTIAMAVFGSTRAGAIVGHVIKKNKRYIPHWFCVANQWRHPVADMEAFELLVSLGYKIVEGCII